VKKAPSIASTVKTGRSGRSRVSKMRRGTDAQSVRTFDWGDDSDYDNEERRLMPMFMRKPPGRKGDTRKALKFLGLA